MSETENFYFESSFARSTALENANRCKSSAYSCRTDSSSSYESDTNREYMAERRPIFPNVSKTANVSPVKFYRNHSNNQVIFNKTNDFVECNVKMEPDKQRNMEEEILKLRMECQNLMEENKRLQRVSLLSSNISSLQSQIETLQWQLKQTESNRQMYRAVMEQVLKFLERVHKNIDLISAKTSTSSKTKIRKPARSTHPEEISLGKLSQEAFRLHRTVQLLLNTKEPDLIQFHRLTPSISEITLPDSNEKIDNISVGSCASLIQTPCSDTRKFIDTSSCSTHRTSDECVNVLPVKNTGNFCSKAVCIEDESGFSSMSSFHDGNILPEMKSYPKLGVPLINFNDSKHKRWNSTPIDKMYSSSNNSVNFCNSEILRVLWV